MISLILLCDQIEYNNIRGPANLPALLYLTNCLLCRSTKDLGKGSMEV